MSITKHKLFLIPIEAGNVNIHDKVLGELNSFLQDDNIVYMGHSITTLSKDEYVTKTNFKAELIPGQPNVDAFFKYKMINTYCILSLVYQDLKGSSNDTIGLSEKGKKMAKQTIEAGKKLPKPKI